MSYILTLVSSDNKRPLLPSHLQEVERCLSSEVFGSHWLCPEKAADLRLSSRPDGPARRVLESLLAEDRIDCFVVPDDRTRQKKLLIAEMDNTMVVGETLDELAAQSGLKKQVSAIAVQAMRGEIDFATALRTRVAMLKDLPEQALLLTLAAIQPAPGAELLITTMRRHGARCVLVSGGLTCFTEPIAAKLGFHGSHGNTLEIRAGKLTGKVGEPILDHQTKLSFLDHYRSSFRLDFAEILAIGDGVNDQAMLAVAGLGVGLRGKPVVEERSGNNLLYGDLTALLFAQGYSYAKGYEYLASR